MYLDVVKEDIQEVGAKEDEVFVGSVENPLWRPQMEKPCEICKLTFSLFWLIFARQNVPVNRTQ